MKLYEAQNKCEMKLKRIRKNKKLISALAIAIGLSTIFMVASSTEINLVNYQIKSDKIKNEFRMILISDYHSCFYGENQSILLDEIRQQEPDVVLLCGDIFDDKLPEENAKQLLFALSKQYLCFYVSGNHEFRSGKVDEIKKMICNYGINVLEGTAIPVEVNGQTITICGLDDPDAGEVVFDKQLKNCADRIQEDHFSLLLSHRPERVDDYRFLGFDLVLSGHAHGGQWRIPRILNGLLAPQQGFFPKYAGGLYQFEKTSMIVSRGLAKESTPVPRIFNRPEIVVIHAMPN